MRMPVDAPHGGPPGRLGDVMSRLARELQEEHGHVAATLDAIARSAVVTIPGADECGISYVTGRRRVEPRAATSELPRVVDQLQTRLGEGPCLDAAWVEKVVRVADVATEDRWPAFAREAAGLGMGSMLCFQLFVTGDQLGALNLYSRTRAGFDAESEEIGLLFASHAAIALAGAEHEADLLAGMAHRDVIGQAKGILMERYKLTSAQAFGLLTRTSSHTNRKLRDIAEDLTETGELPGD